jgi:hypothetical protein
MSVYCSFGTFDEDSGDHPPPLIYRQSHIIPDRTDPRGGSFDLGSIPAFLTRNGYDDGKEDGVMCWPYLRVSLRATQPGEDTIVLDIDQVRVLHTEIGNWINRVDPDLLGG